MIAPASPGAVAAEADRVAACRRLQDLSVYILSPDMGQRMNFPNIDIGAIGGAAASCPNDPEGALRSLGLVLTDDPFAKPGSPTPS